MTQNYEVKEMKVRDHLHIDTIHKCFEATKPQVDDCHPRMEKITLQVWKIGFESKNASNLSFTYLHEERQNISFSSVTFSISPWMFFKEM